MKDKQLPRVWIESPRALWSGGMMPMINAECTDICNEPYLSIQEHAELLAEAESRGRAEGGRLMLIKAMESMLRHKPEQWPDFIEENLEAARAGKRDGGDG